MKKLEDLMTTIAVVFLLWLLLSYVDVNVHNMGTQQYASWNAFVLMTEKVR